MDGVSAVASIIAIVQITEEIADIAKDVIKAPEEYKKLASELRTVTIVLERLKAREEEAQRQPGLTYYQGILQVRHQDGPLARLAATAKILSDVLEPQKGMRKYKAVRNLRYHWDKEKFGEYLDQLTRYTSQISAILDGDQFALSLYSQAHIEEIQNKVDQASGVGEDSNTRIKLLQSASLDHSLALDEVSNRVRELQLDQQTEQDRLRTKEAEQEREEIVRWLSPLKSLERHRQLLDGSFRAGKWFLDESIEFKKWQEGRRWELRAHGEPGSGKVIPANRILTHILMYRQTVLSASIVTYLQTRFPAGKYSVLCIYLEQKDQKNQTPDDLLGDLVKQIVQQNESNSIPDDLKELYHKARIRELRPSLEELQDIFIDLVETFERTYIIVDGLDEASSRASDWLQFELPAMRSEKLSLMFTSRDTIRSSDDIIDCDAGQDEDVRLYWRCYTCDAGAGFYDICQKCIDAGRHCKDRSHPLEEMLPVEVTIETPADELERYVKEEISKEIGKVNTRDWDQALYSRTRRKGFGGQLAHDQDLRERIPRLIAKQAGYKFIFAKLYMDSLKLQRTLADIEDALENLPGSLNELYENIINERIKSQESKADRDNSMRIIAFVCCAGSGRNLHLTELQHALAMKPGENKFNRRRIMTRDDILELTKGLIAIDPDGDGAVVRPFHLTFQEWFDINRAEWFPTADIDMANICLSYLNLQDLSSPINPEDYELRVHEYPFVAYASQEWGNHVHDAANDKGLQAAALRYVRDKDRVAAWSQMAWYTKPRGFAGWDIRKAVDGLFVCAWFGLTPVIEEWSALEELDIDAQEATYGQTPLMYACRKEHVETTSKLLELGALPNLRNSKGRTALFEAARRNPLHMYEAGTASTDPLVNALLCEPSILVDERDNFGYTALMHATELNHLEAVRSLIDHPDTDVNMQDPGGVTPLSRAVLTDWEDGVNILLGKPGINVDLSESRGRSPLILAAERGSLPIVQALLQHQPNVEVKDVLGATAIMRAISEGVETVANTLLDHGADISCKDENEQGLLHAAAGNGDPEMIWALHTRGLHLNMRDKFGKTPIFESSQHGHVEAVRTLVHLGADTSVEDNFERSPALVAWQYGQEKVVEFFKSRAEEAKEKFEVPPKEDLPIWSLTLQGQEDVIQASVSSGKVDSSSVEPITNDSAVHCAIKANQNTILSILLSDKDTPHSSRNYRNHLPLHLAAMSGNVEATNLLIDKGTDLDAIDQWGFTPLIISQKNEHFEVSIRLIEAGACMKPPSVPNGQTNNTNPGSLQALIQRIFFAAVESGSLTAVQRLLDAGADILAVDEVGRTAREIARKSDNEELQRLLQTSRSYFFAVPQDRQASKDASAHEGAPLAQRGSRLVDESEAVPSITANETENLPKELSGSQSQKSDTASFASLDGKHLRMPFPMPVDAKEGS
ncbi:MAG: hypothetical protein M1822_007860 [Bathelium mastoideum]|nr:MAG: hypothetical protein M1822_007860 [Bathelium mastoideum]